MRTLYLFPLKPELEEVLESLKSRGLRVNSMESPAGRVFQSAQADAFAVGGLGDEKIREKALRLLKLLKPQRLVVLGTAGSLSPDRGVAEVFLAEELIYWNQERQTYDKISLLNDPYFDSLSLKKAKIFCVQENVKEDHPLRREKTLTNVLVAQEGRGAFHAASQAGLPYSEIRAVTDFANSETPEEFQKNLKPAMAELAKAIYPSVAQS